MDEKSKLFTRFFRSTSARKRAVQGTGLGLAIVASVVQEHRGTFAVVSENLLGASFVVRLPLAATVVEPRVHAA